MWNELGDGFIELNLSRGLDKYFDKTCKGLVRDVSIKFQDKCNKQKRYCIRLDCVDDDTDDDKKAFANMFDVISVCNELFNTMEIESTYNFHIGSTTIVCANITQETIDKLYVLLRFSGIAVKLPRRKCTI